MKKEMQKQEIHASNNGTDKNVELLDQVLVQEVSLEELEQVVGGTTAAAVISA